MSSRHQLELKDYLENVKELNKCIADMEMQEICQVDYSEEQGKYRLTQVVALYDIEYNKKKSRYEIKKGSKSTAEISLYSELIDVITEINIIATCLDVTGTRALWR